MKQTAETKDGDIKRPNLSGKVPAPPRKKRTTKAKTKKKKPKRKATKRQARPPISVADVKRLAFAYDSIAQADQQAGTTRPLVDLLKEFPQLMTAWGRGELLRRLKACAAVLDNVHDVARQLGFDNGKDVRTWFDNDKEAQDIWLQTRFVTRKEAMAAMVQASMDGNQRAIQVVADRLDEDHQEENAGPKDWHIVSLNQLEQLTGKSRQTIYKWRNQAGMPCTGSAKATRVDLRRFVPWFEEHTALMSKGATVEKPIDPMKQRKIRTMDLRYKQQIGELIRREQVIGYQIAQIKNIVNAFAQVSDLVNLMFNQPREHMLQVMEGFKDDLLNKMKTVPDMLSLSPEAKGILKSLYACLTGPAEEKSSGATDEK